MEVVVVDPSFQALYGLPKWFWKRFSRFTISAYMYFTSTPLFNRFLLVAPPMGHSTNVSVDDILGLVDFTDILNSFKFSTSFFLCSKFTKHFSSHLITWFYNFEMLKKILRNYFKIIACPISEFNNMLNFLRGCNVMPNHLLKLSPDKT